MERRVLIQTGNGRRGLLGAVVFCFLLSCSETPELDCGGASEEVLTSEHFEYRYCAGEPDVDAELLSELERHRSVLGEALGLSESELPERIVYLKDPRKNGFRGKYLVEKGVVHVPQAFNEHDLVHAYAIPAWGQAPQLLMEGLASALACDQADGAVEDWREWVHFDPQGPRAKVGYDLGGRFVTHLVLEKGMATFRKFYEAVSQKGSLSEFESEFERIYGEKLDEVWERALLSPEFCLPVWACASPLVADGEEFTLGKTRPGSGLRSFEVGENGLRAQVSGAGFRPMRCEPPHVSGYVGGTLLVGGQQDLIEEHEKPYVAWLDLPPGRYAATHYTRAMSVGVTQVTLDSPETPWASGSCEELGAIELHPNQLTQISLDPKRSLSDAEGRSLPRVLVKSSGEEQFQVELSGTGAQALFCAGCADVECSAELESSGGLSLDSGVFLRSAPGAGFSTFWFSPLP